jgi:DnaJ family protein C protein 28
MNIEEQIRRAMEEGQFENLPGKGRPLKLDENALEDPEWRMANKILKEGGFSLPWIERRQEIENGLGTARAALRRAWEWRCEGQEAKQPEAFVEDQWQQAIRVFRDQLETLNRSIFLYNLEVPSPQFQRLPLNAEREIAELTRAVAGQ